MYDNDDRGGQVPGQNDAVVSLVLGILSVVLWFFGYSSFLSIVLGVLGLVYASKSKRLGFNGGIRTAGFVLSLIGVIGGAFVFIACIACVGAIGALSAFSY